MLSSPRDTISMKANARIWCIWRLWGERQRSWPFLKISGIKMDAFWILTMGCVMVFANVDTNSLVILFKPACFGDDGICRVLLLSDLSPWDDNIHVENIVMMMPTRINPAAKTSIFILGTYLKDVLQFSAFWTVIQRYSRVIFSWRSVRRRASFLWKKKITRWEDDVKEC